MSIQAPRKLLILDLNGTLLLRSKRTRHGPLHHHPPRPRVVYPRPYLNSFREYIFHPSTMLWLDTMVWSSAQPPNVADMVNHCFGEQQRNFLAIWARDTLGLAPELYNQKTQTTKDLAKPWGAFPAHSANTTVLLDDSALKAHLHPWNHVCVREYIQETRTRDLAVWLSSKTAQADAMLRKPKKKSKPKKVAEPFRPVELPADPASGGPATPAWFLTSPKYDETLLAVIGILETMKNQANVADWIKGGGLFFQDAAKPNAAEEKDRPPSPRSLVSAVDAELWINNEVTVNHWVDEGVLALGALQIDVVSGIESEVPLFR
ncbi:hypothetical protein B0H10DRAFT_1913833 [Mycena sp. CBHHK59/15]|nr:hypothetical protein B0H10DRAFT_1913833 [Mycena sp. CBHHK59/15]